MAKKVIKKAPARAKRARAQASRAKAATVLVLRTCAADMTAYGGFVWPEAGEVSAPDFDPTPVCGQGLHGLAWGLGDGDLLNWSPDAKWLVVEVLESELVELDGKVKFPKGRVVYCGNREGATQTIADVKLGPIAGLTIQTSGTRSVVAAGFRGTATAGDQGTATAGYYGTATAGYYGTATAGDQGTATAGYYGTATAGDQGTATAGYGGTATAGEGGTATAGYGGTLDVRWYDGRRYRRSVAYVGEGGILPNTKYRLNAKGEFEVVP